MTFTQTPIVFLKNSMGVFIIHIHNSIAVCEENSGFRIEKRRFTGRKTAFYENKTAVFNLKNGGLRVEKRRFTKIKPRFST